MSSVRPLNVLICVALPSAQWVIRPVTLTDRREAYPTPQSLKFVEMDKFGWPKMGKATELIGASLVELHREWNQTYPEGHGWHYENPKTFLRDFRKTEKEIAHPLYNPRTRKALHDG